MRGFLGAIWRLATASSCSRWAGIPPCAHLIPQQGAAPFLQAPQVFKEAQPGLGVSRLNNAEFLHFAELATLATRYVRVKEVRLQHAGLA